MSSVLPSMKGKASMIRDQDDVPQTFTVVDDIVRVQHDANTKALAFQLLHWTATGAYEIRTGWYFWIEGDEGSGHWRWAQSPQMAPVRDFAAMAAEAEKRGWFRKR